MRYLSGSQGAPEKGILRFKNLDGRNPANQLRLVVYSPLVNKLLTRPYFWGEPGGGIG